jgi:translation initiation factor IF-2
MSETKNPGEKKLSVSGKTLTLKPRSETGTVRQSFSHGRSKQVVVEKVKRRVVGGETKAEAPPAAEPKKFAGKATTAPAASRAATQAETAPKPKPSGVVLRTLTEEERSARAHALADSRVREAEERKIAEEEAAAAPAAKQPIVPNARQRKRANAMKKSAASTTRKPNARLARSPRSASAWMKLRAAGRAPVSHSKPTKMKRRAAGVAPADRQPLRARRLALAPRNSADVLPSSMR